MKTNFQVGPGSRARETRDLLGLSQAEVAERAGLTQSRINRFEHGTEIRDSAVVALSSALYVDVRWLLTGYIDKAVCEKFDSTRRKIGGSESVAERLAVPSKFVKAIERCEILPSDAFVDKLCGAFHLNKYDLMSGRFPAQAALDSTGDSKMDYDIVMTNPQDLSPKQKEIVSLLKEDQDAEDQILTLLRGRKQARDAIDGLKL